MERGVGFFSCPGRSGPGDGFHGVLGRALIVAQSFEANCRALGKAAGAGPGRPVPKDAVERLALGSSALITGGDAPDRDGRGLVARAGDFEKIVLRAKAARREIAESAGLGFVSGSGAAGGALERLEALVRAVAEGDRLVAAVLAMSGDGPPVPREFFDAYPAKVADWVFSTAESAPFPTTGRNL